MSSHYLAYLLNETRQALADEGTTLIWEDHELETHILKAVEEVSEVAPNEQVDTLTTTASKDLDISSLTNRVTNWGIGGFHPQYGVEFEVSQEPAVYRNFHVRGDVLSMRLSSTPAADKSVNVRWAQYHKVTRTSTTLTPYLEKVVIEGACAYALLAWASSPTNINMVHEGGPNVVPAVAQAGDKKMAFFLRSLEGLRPVMTMPEYSED